MEEKGRLDRNGKLLNIGDEVYLKDDKQNKYTITHFVKSDDAPEESGFTAVVLYRAPVGSYRSHCAYVELANG